MDKRLTKLAMASAGIPTPRFFSIRRADLRAGPIDWEGIVEREAGRVPLPWVFKPNRLGSSVGVAILKGADEVIRGAQAAIEEWPDSAREDDLLVEEAVTGRELTCGVLETGILDEAGRPRALPPIEIRPRTSAFFDYRAKYTPGASEEICPAPLAPAERDLVQSTALKVHRLFECAPLSRTDMFLTPSGGVQVLEVNTLPGMTETSLIPLSASKDGIALGDLFGALVDHAVARAARSARAARVEAPAVRG
jgi:D-alanine-D-alanine ligase